MDSLDYGGDEYTDGRSKEADWGQIIPEIQLASDKQSHRGNPDLLNSKHDSFNHRGDSLNNYSKKVVRSDATCFTTASLSNGSSRPNSDHKSRATCNAPTILKLNVMNAELLLSLFLTLRLLARLKNLFGTSPVSSLNFLVVPMVFRHFFTLYNCTNLLTFQ